jgi:RNA polymerase sigma-70 factor (ECF subfamily)
VTHPAQDVDVRDLIQDLPVRMRNAFLLHYYAGFGVREVAALLGRPEGTIKADLFQARNRLKASMGESDG